MYNVASSFSTGKDLHGLENTEPIEVQEGSLVCSAAPLPRQALSQGLSRPEYLPQHRPPWWPFASVSDGEGRKAFTAEKLRQVVRSYNAYYNLQLQQSVEAPPSPPSPAPATPAAAETPAAPLTPLTPSNPHPTPPHPMR
ncbi:desiccation/radiation resistance protein DR_1769-like isoform X3 [Alosa sapidissima]|uniref:desiccation/radiation resistance protein DR_1769-like isoform X3 n=1 Tax=Alosa sapidissima TaxID=34773 RepID=UPI001C0A314D|nr:desiccation/radiation resistance protein DR_1769-like isoform X3 [Alosa sapidissima]